MNEIFWIFLIWKFQYFQLKQKYFDIKASKHLISVLEYISPSPYVMLLFKKNNLNSV